MSSLRDMAKEARGSALWDAAKWLCAAGGSALTAIAQAVYGWSTGHPNLAAVVVSGITVGFLGIVAMIIHAKPRVTREYRPTETTASVLRTQESTQIADDFLKNAPQLLVHYSGYGLIEKLTFENAADNAATKIELGPLVWCEQQPLGLDHGISAVSRSRPEECKMRPVEIKGDGNKAALLTTLLQFMRDRTPINAVTSVTVSYEDSQGRKFSRQFILTTYPDGTISWMPEPVKLHRG